MVGNKWVHRYGTASQSSTLYNLHASKAIDGKLQGTFTDKTITHTDEGLGQYWKLILKNAGVVHRIRVYNRTDTLMERLDGAYLVMYDENNHPFFVKKLRGILVNEIQIP
ncbi:unnamed protein product [Ectocarpus sp. 6 AP-2014]